MKKINKKGFALAETLVVSVFVAAIITIVFVNYYPLIGEYEKRENYDDIDGKYASYWVKTIIEDNAIYSSDFKDNVILTINNNKFYEFSCNNNYFTDDKSELCNNLLNELNIKNVFITDYKILNPPNNGFKLYISNNDYSKGLKDYVKYLPEYTKTPTSNAKYRVIIEMNRTKDDNDYNAYATMEVIL